MLEALHTLSCSPQNCDTPEACHANHTIYSHRHHLVRPGIQQKLQDQSSRQRFNSRIYIISSILKVPLIFRFHSKAVPNKPLVNDRLLSAFIDSGCPTCRTESTTDPCTPIRSIASEKSNLEADRSLALNGFFVTVVRASLLGQAGSPQSTAHEGSPARLLSEGTL